MDESQFDADAALDGAAVARTPRARYEQDLAAGRIHADESQRAAVDALQDVFDALVATPPRRRFGFTRSGWTAVPGLYLWGGVGRGKTYLMDAFFEALPFSPKRRTHFHRFMLDVHERRARYPQERDPLLRVAADIAGETRVLCFDEFLVADIADAMILGRLFEALFERGITLIATSNVPPDGLYKDGLQRDRFLPAIERLKAHTHVLNVDGGIDYRLRALHGVPLYLAPFDAAAETRLDDYFRRLAPGGQRGAGILRINGRDLHAQQLAEGGAWFGFAELCETARAPADYIELARSFHVIVLTEVPRMKAERDDAARRFITLIDEFYDRGVKLLIGADVPPAQLYDGTRLLFEFQRTQSRLMEMQSREYLAKPHLS